MQSRSRTTLAVYFGSLFALTLVVSAFLHEPSSTTGQMIRTPEASAAGFTVVPNTNTFFSCAEDGPLLADGVGDASDFTFWVYEFTGNEPPWDGKYFMTPKVLASAQLNASYSTLDKITAHKRYYIHSDVPLLFSCDTGIRPQPRCGNGIKEVPEECDSVEGCTNTCVAQTGYECDATQNTCMILVPKLGGASSSSFAPEEESSSSSSSSEAMQPAAAESSSAQTTSTTFSIAQSSSISSSPSSRAASRQISSAASSSSFSDWNVKPSTGRHSSSISIPSEPIVEFNKFAMDYVTIPSSDQLKKGQEFTLEVRIQNYANAPRNFKVFNDTSVKNPVSTAQEQTDAVYNIEPDAQNITGNCAVDSTPTYHRWRNYCQIVLAPGEVQVLKFPFIVNEDITCTSNLNAKVMLMTKVQSYDKTYTRSIRIVPDGCNLVFGAPTHQSCVPLAYAQAHGDVFPSTLISSDGSFVVYKTNSDNDSTNRKLYKLDTATCTEHTLASTPSNMAVNTVLLSNNNDILYELSQWYIPSGHPKRSLHRVDGNTGADTTIVPYAPKNTGVSSVDLSDDGTQVAFVATWVDLDNDPTTNYNNADDSTELFVWHDGIITQITNCTPQKYDHYNDCIIAYPAFSGPTNRYIGFRADYNPTTGVPDEKGAGYKLPYYVYDTQEKKIVNSAIQLSDPLVN